MDVLGRNTSDQTGDKQLVGWVPEGNDCGTWSVVVTSFVTIIICTWTVLHPRIHVGRKLRRVHKACQLVKQVLASELESIEALQEFLQARKTLDCCTSSTSNGLKLSQSFLIGMMGVRYRTRTHGGYRVLWLMQFAYLLNSGILSWPLNESYGPEEELIEDKSKADGLVKLVALWQVTWFTINCIARGVYNLELAPLESMTLVYVVQTVLTYCLWWKKPKDVATVSLVSLPDMNDEQYRTFEALSMEATYDVPDPSSTHQSMGIVWYIIPRDCSAMGLSNCQSWYLRRYPRGVVNTKQRCGTSAREERPGRRATQSNDTVAELAVNKPPAQARHCYKGY